jgi:hypothetical protein
MASEVGTQYYKKRQESVERLAYQIKRKKIANEIIRLADEHIDECLKQAEIIYRGKKAAKTKEHQILWAEQEQYFHDTTIVVLGKETLLERAQQKGPTTVEALRNLIAGRTEL